MGDRNFTLVEYHSHGDGPRLFPDFFGGGREEETEPEASSREDDGSSRGIGLLVVAAVLIGTAVAYKYFQSDTEEVAPESEQVEVTEYDG